jgi:hypothetical protein
MVAQLGPALCPGAITTKLSRGKLFAVAPKWLSLQKGLVYVFKNFFLGHTFSVTAILNWLHGFGPS